ncbi:hypothetical protein [Okeania sp. SIO2B3]|uniref:hypothetical protein n=1 Tax=Okeania sp. SIO2B3 TaxID=2607784 RepID=UPI0013C0C7E9|nr:hypothetical protein [Okeania sp. SIO2B3]NET45081.1 hypothetical protein [Okeania sp. SIO2B3]
MKKAEGLTKSEVRRQKAEGRRENCLWIVFDTPLRVYKPQTILSTPLDGGVLNPPQTKIMNNHKYF